MTSVTAGVALWSLTAWTLPALLLVCLLTAAATVDLTRRSSAESLAHVQSRFAAGCGVLLGTGVWAGHFVALRGQSLPFVPSYGGWLTLCGWAMAVALSIWGMALALPSQGLLWRQFASGAALSLGLAATNALCLLDMHIAPALQWRWPWAAAGVAATALCGGVAAILLNHPKCRPMRHATPAAIGVFALALTAGHWAASRMWLLPAGAEAPPQAIDRQALDALAWIATPMLLLTVLLMSKARAPLRIALRQAQVTARTVSRTDPLTGLHNRVALEHALEAAAQEADRRAGSMALLLVSLDDFRAVNDSFGRAVGDKILQAIAKRLHAKVGKAGLLARVGGDDFALLHADDIEAAGIVALARSMLDAVSALSAADGREVMLSCSIGMVRYPQHGAQSTMLVHAEAAVESVKKAGGGGSAIFESQMLVGAREHLELLRDLRTAVGSSQFELYYQPKVNAHTGAIAGVEALMRWHHPKRGMVTPLQFIPVAERHGLIGPLGDWLIDEACRQARVWRDDGLRMRVAINLSVIQLRQPDLVQRIAAALTKYQITPQLLTCEITESLAMEDTAAMARFFEQLAEIGVRLSIDDFGTGYSSLAYLRKLPAEELKIDRGFVLDLESSADARAVVDAVVKLAHALSLKVVAEGVETEAQRKILQGLGCDQLQGYLFAKPMSAKALGLWAMTNDGPTPLRFGDSLFRDTAVDATEAL